MVALPARYVSSSGRSVGWFSRIGTGYSGKPSGSAMVAKPRPWVSS